MKDEVIKTVKLSRQRWLGLIREEDGRHYISTFGDKACIWGTLYKYVIERENDPVERFDAIAKEMMPKRKEKTK